MQNQTPLVESIVKGIQEKKGREITIADLSHIVSAPARHFVICTCGSPQQVEAVADSVKEFALKECGERPSAIAGRQNALWVAMDYGTVMVHIFVPDARDHYDLEHLWGAAQLQDIPDLD